MPSSFLFHLKNRIVFPGNREPYDEFKFPISSVLFTEKIVQNKTEEITQHNKQQI